MQPFRAVLAAFFVVCLVALSAGSMPLARADTAPVATSDAPGAPNASPTTPNGPPGEPNAGLSLSRLSSRVFFWVQDQQKWLNDSMGNSIEGLAGGHGGALVLGAFSFLYGVLHAVGPGHGKAVISSYVLANERTVRRGILLSFMAGFFQALSAILLVSVLALLLHFSSRRMSTISNNLETVSYAVITLFGAWLLIAQIRSYWKSSSPVRLVADDHDHAHDHDDHDHGHDHADHDHEHHDHDHGHDHDGHDHHGHAHLPGPEQLEGKWSWAKAVGLAFMVGLRPCTGALIVLVVALRQGVYAAGVISTFVMAFGTAITVSLLATMAVGSRELATRLASVSERWVGRIETAAKFGGGLVMLVVGFLFFLASLYPHPFQ